MVSILDIVKEYRGDFTRLVNVFNSLRNGLLIKRCNKVFYSDTERYYYDKYLIEDLRRNYGELYDKYVISKHPESKDLLDMKRLVGPNELEEILDSLSG